VGPGGSISIILPAWATNVEDRFQKLIPLTGFQPESSGVIYRTPGIPETELRYRKPSEETKERDIVPVAPNSHEENRPVENITKEYPFSREETNAQPSWHSTVHGHLDGIITKTALKIITQRQEAIPYRELLNQVYLDLVDRKIDFESSRQIETVLLAHAGSELEIVEENDPTHGRLIRKWSLGERRMRIPTDTAQGWISRGGGKVRRSMSKLKMFGRRSRYHRRRQKDEDQ
jgi:hypothetical protein